MELVVMESMEEMSIDGLVARHGSSIRMELGVMHVIMRNGFRILNFINLS